MAERFTITESPEGYELRDRGRMVSTTRDENTAHTRLLRAQAEAEQAPRAASTVTPTYWR